MGRLTKRHGKHAVQIGGETRRNDVGWLRLADYEDLEEQGRLIELPCAVGDTVYLIEESYEDALLPSTLYYYIEENPFDVWMLCGVGKTVFLTEEEAEAKLAELKGAEHDQTNYKTLL